MKKFGIIAYVNLDKKIIGIMERKNLKYYYLPTRLMKLFKRYLYVGNVITFICDNEQDIKGNLYSHEIQIVLNIFVPGKYKNDIFFDKNEISNSMFKLLSGLKNIMFLDLEMTMGRFYGNKDLSGEIVQAAFFIVKSGKVLEKKKYTIKPTRTKYFNSLTKDFLNLEKEDIKGAMSYYDFLNDFKIYIKKYRPTVIVWGKNDITAINKSYIINRVNPATKWTKFIDLNSLIKNYYGLSQDPGLFKLYQQYNQGFEKEQIHDPLEDAFITYQIFNHFLNDLKTGEYSIENT